MLGIRNEIPTSYFDDRKHMHHDNGGAACDWKVLLIRPPLRGATAFAAILSKGENT